MMKNTAQDNGVFIGLKAMLSLSFSRGSTRPSFQSNRVFSVRQETSTAVQAGGAPSRFAEPAQTTRNGRHPPHSESVLPMKGTGDEEVTQEFKYSGVWE